MWVGVKGEANAAFDSFDESKFREVVKFGYKMYQLLIQIFSNIEYILPLPYIVYNNSL